MIVEGPKQTPYVPDEGWIELFKECWEREQYKQQLADYQRTEYNDQMREIIDE